MSETTNSISSPSDFADDEVGLHQYWTSEIEAAKKELKLFHTRGKKIVDIYLDNRTLTGADDRNFNLFASNVGILKASLYGRIPKPDVSRRFIDYDDDVARVAGVILERALSYELENDPTFDINARNSIEDRLLPGLGCAWVRYDTEREEQEIQITNDVLEQVEDDFDDLEPQTETVIVDESTPIDYVYWGDFFYSPARTWSEVRWVARRVFLCKDELEDRFGEEKARLVSMSVDEKRNTNASTAPKNQVMQQGEVFEIWDKTSKRVLWYSPSAGELLDWKDDPLGLPGYFPCPKPLMANSTTSNLMPLADYALVQDQYSELNQLNNRISKIVEACKVAGVYDSDSKGIAGLLSDGRENVLIPVDRWAAFAEKGGMNGAIAFLPIGEMSNVLVVLQKARDIVKQQIYELTGISDIMRGSTQQYETAAAQHIKNSYGSMRLSAMQQEIAMFFSELVQMKAHLMVKFYEPERLLARCGMLNQADAKYIPQAIDLLKNAQLSHYRINVSVDSLVAPNMDAERGERTAALTAISSFLEKAVPASQNIPQMGPMLMSMLKWAVAGFRATKDLEGILDAGISQLASAQAEQQGKPKPPTPAELELQGKAAQAQHNFELAQARLQLDATIAQNNFALEQQKLQLRAQELEIEKAKLQVNVELTAAANQTEATLQNRALDIKADQAQFDAIATVAGAHNAKEQHFIDSQIKLQGQVAKSGFDTSVNSNSPSSL